MADKRSGLAAVVGIAAGIATVGAGLLAYVQFFSDDSAKRMDALLNSADGVQTALERIAERIETEPELVGRNDAEATGIARAAEAVNQTIGTAARAQGLAIAPAALLGEQFVLARSAPVLMQTSRGTLFGMALHQHSFQSGRGGVLQIDNVRYGTLHEGDILRFTVGEEDCQAFLSAIRPEAEEITVSLRCE